MIEVCGWGFRDFEVICEKPSPKFWENLKWFEGVSVIKMGIIDDEISELRRVTETQVPNAKLEACVPEMIRVQIE